jgi:hypothetical protein
MNKILTFFLIFATLGISVKAQEPKFQAMFVYNFTRTLQWPVDAQKGDFVIGVFGDSEIFKELKTFTQDKKVRGEQKIVVEKITESEAGKCQIVVVTKSKNSDLSTILSAVSGKSTLVITEVSGKTIDGAGISFSKDDSGIVNYEFSEKNIKKQNIDVSTSFREVGTAK